MEYDQRIKVRVQACFVSPIMVTPYSNEARLATIMDRQHKGRPTDTPVVCMTSDKLFEVLFAWDVVESASSTGVEEIWVHLAPDTVESKLRWGVVEQAKLLDLGWVAVARALIEAKRHLSLNNTECGSATLLGRTTVSRYIKIVKSLHPRLLHLAEIGRLNYTDCRKLVGLPITRQAEIAAIASERGWDRWKIMEAAYPAAALPSPGNSERSSSISGSKKSTDIKRLEITISEEIGYPVRIDQGVVPGSGSISYQFFDRPGLIDVLSKLRSGFSSRAVPKGEIRLEFGNLEEFDALVGGFMAEGE